jgi:hypothetical protein
MTPMGYSGARGKLIHEKKPNSKILCQTPFRRPKNVVHVIILVFDVYSLKPIYLGQRHTQLAGCGYCEKMI